MRHTVPQDVFSPPPSRNGYHTSKSTPHCPLFKLNSSRGFILQTFYTQGWTVEASACGKPWEEKNFQKCLLQLCTNVPFLSLRHCHFNRNKNSVPVLMQEPMERAQGISQGKDALLGGKGAQEQKE